MSENLDLVRAIYAAWEQGDYRSAEWAHSQIEYVILGSGIFPSVRTKGLAGLREAARGNIEVWKGVRLEAEQYREWDGERVLVLDHRSGRGTHSGLKIEQFAPKGAHLFHLRHGKVTRLVVYGDRDRAFADLGLERYAVSQENVEIVERAIDAFNRRDLDAWLAEWDVRCEYRPAMERDMAGDDDSFRGHQGLRRWWQEMSDAWSYWHDEVHEIHPVADRVFMSITLRGKGRTSGVEIEAPFFLVGTIRDGKLLSSRDYADRAEALKAVGLEE